MTQEELNYIKDSFSQILDDIGGNPDWYDAAKAVASDLGTIEKQLEERITKLPSNLDEAAEKYACTEYPPYYEMPDDNWKERAGYMKGFKSGAKWMAGQGETFNGYISMKGKRSLIAIEGKSEYKFGDKVIVQIRKK